MRCPVVVVGSPSPTPQVKLNFVAARGGSFEKLVGIALKSGAGCKISVRLWRSAGLKIFDAELGFDVELGDTLQSAG